MKQGMAAGPCLYLNARTRGKKRSHTMQDIRILFFDIDGTLIDGKCNRLTRAR